MTDDQRQRVRELLDDALSDAGARASLAARLNVTPGFISKLLRTGRVPAERALDVADATGIPAGVLRPDVYPPERVTIAPRRLQLARSA